MEQIIKKKIWNLSVGVSLINRKYNCGGAWLAPSVEHAETLDLGAMSSSPMLGAEITLKNKIFKKESTIAAINEAGQAR